MHFHYITETPPCQGENVEILHDRSASGRERPWHVRKLENQYISAAYEEVDGKKAGRLAACADALLFTHKDGGGLKLKHANFCRVRLCPICAWRRSLKNQSHMNKILAAAEPQRLEYLLVTLTLRNCTPDKLGSTLDTLIGGFKKLVKRRLYSQVWIGWYRGVEVTHNVQEDTYHPHIHALVGVKPSYFKGGNYINQSQLAEDWKASCGLEYSPIVDIRKVKRWSGGQARTRTDIIKAVNEVAKYTTKSSDIIDFDDWDMTVDTVRILDRAFDKRRFIAYGGLFKVLHKQLNLDDTEDGDLVHVDDQYGDGSSKPDDELLFFWHTGYSRYVR